MYRFSFKILFLAVSAFALISPRVFADAQPWRINDAYDLPDWLSLSGSHRMRFESLDQQFRNNRDGGDQVFLFRTLLLAQVKMENFRIGLEMEDSRQELADSGTPLNTTIVNPLELLQAYAEVSIDNLFVNGSKSRLRGGRITMDVGSRRLVARNRYRNTLNAFTGIDWQWTGSDKSEFRFFYTLPIQRRVSGNILYNKPRFDKEREDVRFWGIYYSPASLPWGDSAEVYLFGLNEKDTADLATANRDIYTAGFRLYRKPGKGQFDYQLESIFQFGESRASRTATTNLDHFAHYQHAAIAYTFNHPWSPRLLLQYDYASGDENPNDDDNNRFSTLFGARRFEYGPTSIYGAFARANLNSPGLRLIIKPRKKVNLMFALRGFWLASADDAWTTSGISNPVGQSENYIGTQVETRLRWDIIPENLRLEAGAAHIFAGELMDQAGKKDVSYFYTQAVFSF